VKCFSYLRHRETILDPEQILQTALELSNQNRCAEVAALLLRVIAEPWPIQTSRDFLGKAYDLACRAILASHGHSGRAQNAVRELCAESLRRYGRQPWTDLYDGALLHLAGKHDEAVQCYRAAEADAALLLPLSNGCKTVLTLDEIREFAYDRDAGISRPSANMSFENAAQPGPAVAVVAADHAYLMRHGNSFFQSVQAHGAGITTHLHLVNPELEDYAFISDGVRSGKWPPLKLSTEVYDGPDSRAYYASVRLLRAPVLLEAYNRPLLISDIDSVYEEPILPLLPFVTSFDVGLFFKNNRHRYRAHPWQTIRAGILMCAPTGAGRLFCKAVERITMRAFDKFKGKDIWFIDQNMLYSAWLLSRIDKWNLQIADFGCPLLRPAHRLGMTGLRPSE
jgi:hypothetical protein